MGGLFCTGRLGGGGLFLWNISGWSVQETWVYFWKTWRGPPCGLLGTSFMGSWWFLFVEPWGSVVKQARVVQSRVVEYLHVGRLSTSW